MQLFSLAWIFLGACIFAGAVEAKAVFAHFMVTNAAKYSITDWQNDIRLAQEAHIDAFALNMAYGDPPNSASVSNAFTAANSLGFKLVFSFDYAGNGPWPEEAVVSFINEYSSNGAYYYHNGQPFVSTFEGPSSAADWATIKQQTGCFFIPDWSSLGAKAALEPGTADGLFSWAAWPWGNHDMTTYDDASYLDFLGGKPYMMAASPWFFTNLPGYDKNWLWRGDDLWFDRWQEILYIQPDFVEIISWNDYGESHYIGPLCDDAYDAFDIGKASYNYAENMPHDGWRLFLPFVIDTYKNGIGSVTREGLVTWYRLHPKGACSSGGTTGNTAMQLQLEFEPSAIVEDKIFFSALLASPATVTVSIGGVAQAADWDDIPDGNIGIYHGSVPFDGKTGQVVITIARSGTTIAQVVGESITTSCPNGIQNWNAWVGSASGSQAISATPTLKLNERHCIQGTGANNFAGLCSFTCYYGYCPYGACTCTAMGAQRELPDATGVQGYPIEGEDASYGGVCSFACNYGYCPEEACGTVQVPLTTPTVSDFSPPACVAGTGDGNLAGLCSFSCNFGYCPINACTCTATGALNVPPPATSASGHASASMDKSMYDGLCNFACSRGYCPEGACSNSPTDDESSNQIKCGSGASCPLNACCSKDGICGVTPDHCGAGCQGDCSQPRPSVSTSDVRQRVVGYYQGLSETASCGNMSPDDIPIDQLTHLVLASAYITPDTFQITNMDGVSPSLFSRVPNLKLRNGDLKVLLSIGGWGFNNPGNWQGVFASAMSTESSRAKLIQNILGFLSQYGFDGVDFDWEYPGANDRGGSDGDTYHYSAFLKELRIAVGADSHDYLITFTAPMSYQYLQNFDLATMAAYADWINFATYDLHGIWDVKSSKKDIVQAQSNLTDIEFALDLGWRAGLAPSKIVMGLGLYARSFRLRDPSCYHPGCPFSGTGDSGPCTNSPGILSLREVADVLDRSGAQPIYDSNAAVNYIVDSSLNWISYDDPRSLQAKIDFANKNGLGGIMIWSIDWDNQNHDGLNALSATDEDPSDYPITKKPIYHDPPQPGDTSVAHSETDASGCYVTDKCGSQELCKKGYTVMTRTGTKAGQQNCPTNDFRYVCCPSYAAPKPSQCHWNFDRANSNGGKGLGTDCNGGCNVGEVQITADSWGWSGDINTGNAGSRCGRGAVSYCCKATDYTQILGICQWTPCGLSPKCPAERPVKLTSDTGGPSNSERCDTYSVGQSTAIQTRSLCCPTDHNLVNCNWHDGSSCSERCPSGQIEIDSDPFGGPRNTACANARQAKFCCDPPAGIDNPFSVVALDKLFPSAYLPPPDALPQYELVTFGGKFAAEGNEDPNTSGVAFMLLAGSDTSVSRMKKRDGEDDGIEFLDCPDNIDSTEDTDLQVARVICIGQQFSECFPVKKAGVEGTLVSMPQECGGGFARAIAMTLSSNQSIPEAIAIRNPTSAVFDFTFDYDMKQVRRDGGGISMRVDFSNVPGYWGVVVDSPGLGSSRRDLDRRFFSTTPEDWRERIASLHFDQADANSWQYDEDKLLLFESNNACPVNSNLIPEGLAMAVHTEVWADSYYGFSMVATIDSHKLNVHQANGFYQASGKSNFIAELRGLGRFDATKAGSNPVFTNPDRRLQGVRNIFRGFIGFTPYLQVQHTLGSSGVDGTGAAEWNGYANGRVESDFYHGVQNFPHTGHETYGGTYPAYYESGGLYPNTLNPDGNTAGLISASAIADMGLKVDLSLPADIGPLAKTLADMSFRSESSVVFSSDNQTNSNQEQTCLYVLGGLKHDSNLNTIYGSPLTSVGWTSSSVNIFSDMEAINGADCFQNQAGNSKRDISERGSPSSGTYIPGEDRLSLFKNLVPYIVQAAPGAANGAANGLLATKNQIFGAISQLTPSKTSIISSLNYASAVLEETAAYMCEDTEGEGEEKRGCCGCISLMAKYGRRDETGSDTAGDNDDNPDPIDPSLVNDESCPDYSPDTDGNSEKRSLHEIAEPVDEDVHQALSKRAIDKIINTDRKTISVAGQKWLAPQHPSFPKYQKVFPPLRDWEAVRNPNLRLVRRYYQNASAACDNWDVSQTVNYDTEYYAPGQICRISYDTEHVLEGQTIGQFFTDYISRGNLTWFNKTVSHQPQPNLNADWVRQWVLSPDTFGQWKSQDPGCSSKTVNYPFIDRVLQELGSVFARGSGGHPDRLTLFPTDPNIKKGHLFGGSNATAWDAFRKTFKLDEERKLVLKEIGMIYTYMNLGEISQAFCDTFEGIYSLMGDFDNWYFGKNLVNPDLQSKWRNFVREVLDNVVLNGRNNVRALWAAVLNDLGNNQLDQQWTNVAQREAKKMKLTFQCKHMLPTTVTDDFTLNVPDPDVEMGGT